MRATTTRLCVAASAACDPVAHNTITRLQHIIATPVITPHCITSLQHRVITSHHANRYRYPYRMIFDKSCWFSMKKIVTQKIGVNRQSTINKNRARKPNALDAESVERPVKRHDDHRHIVCSHQDHAHANSIDNRQQHIAKDSLLFFFLKIIIVIIITNQQRSAMRRRSNNPNDNNTQKEQQIVSCLRISLCLSLTIFIPNTNNQYTKGQQHVVGKREEAGKREQEGNLDEALGGLGSVRTASHHVDRLWRVCARGEDGKRRSMGDWLITID